MKSQILTSFVLTAILGISTAFAVPNWTQVPRGAAVLSDSADDTPTTISHPTTVTVHPRAVRSTLPVEETPSDAKRSPKVPTTKDDDINSWGGFARREDENSNTNTDTRGSEKPTSHNDGRHQTIYRRGVAGNPGAIIGIVAGCLFVVGLIWFGVCYYNGTMVN
ncbi:hypothetical protein QR685DRAFT_580571 [Neurospora intermedia]|uniref:Transmembrane protein n=1 Tax=Neurospora intermedia TaxID=5142 RepID=A0ABR3D1D0_NEUIN